MPTQVQLRGGTSSENDGFTGAIREVTVDTSNNSIRIHDGTTAGGHRLLTVREFTANINLEGSFIQANNIVTAGLSIKNDNHKFIVTVASKTAAHPYYGSGSSSAYFIDGEESPYILLAPGITYFFDQSDSSNASHPLRFYTDVTKNNSYTTGVTTNGTPGSAGAWTKIVPTSTTTCVLYYQCSAHGYMGSGASVVNGYNPNFYQVANAQSDLANTNLAIADRMQVANSKITNLQDVEQGTTPSDGQILKYSSSNSTFYFAADGGGSGGGGSGDVANSYLTSTYVQNTVFQSALANTNTYIATKLDSSSYTTADVQSKAALGNTNSFIATKLDSSSYTTADVQSKAALANTNSAISDRLQVANATIVNLGDVVQGVSPTNGQVLKYASGNSTFYFADDISGSGGSTTLTGLSDIVQGVNPSDNDILKFVGANSTFVFTQAGNGDVGNTYLQATFVANAAFQSALANTNTYIATKLDSSSYTTADVQSKAALGNTNLYIATKLDSSSYTTADVQSKAALGNTNNYIATKLDSSSYTTADVQSKAALGNTNNYIATKLDSSSYTTSDVQSKAALANTNAYIQTMLQVTNAVTTIGGLSDVVQGVTPTDNYILKYNAANTTWLYEADGGAGSVSISGLSDVVQGVTPSDNYILKYNAANTTWLFEADSTGSGGSGGTSLTRSIDTFTGNGSTTAFTLAAAPTSENNLDVLIDGVLQMRSTYSVSGTTLTLSQAPVNGAEIEVTTTDGSAYTLTSGILNRTHTSFEGDGSTVNYTLDATPTNENNLDVVVDGLVQHRDTYSVSGTTLTFSAAPSLGANVQVTITEGSVASGTITSQSDVEQGRSPSNGDMIKFVSSNSTFVFSDDIQGVYTDKSQVLDIRGADVATTSNTIQIDASLGNFVSANLNANVTSMSVSNIPATGTPYSFTLRFKYPDAVTRAVTWGSSVYWPGNTAPTLTCTANTVDTFVFYTIDGGSHILGFTAGQNHYLINEDG